jgi:transcriptional regulator with XRE-family HTH domain
MSTPHAVHEWQSDPVIATIRAELARRGIRPAALPRLLGNSQAYWGRRMIGDTELSVSDLRLVADLLGVSVATFFADDDKAPRPEPRGGEAARAWRDSNPQPSDLDSNVIDVWFGAGDPNTAEHTPAQVYAFPGGRS